MTFKTPMKALEIAKNLEKKAKSKAKEPEPEKAEIVQLPIWAEPVRSVPNVCLRSALFGALKKGSTQSVKEETIFTQSDFSIIYSGFKLDQKDLDVWETALHIARVQALGTECRFTAYQFLKMLGKPDNGSYRAMLHSSLINLKANALEVKTKKFTYIGSLIDEVYKDEQTKEYVLILNPKLILLFQPSEYTQFDWEERQLLGSNQLAKWLHGYYGSNADPYPIKIETLHKLSGSETKEIWKFKQTLVKALDRLKEVIDGFKYQIIGDLVHVDRKPSNSQKRHLLKKNPNLKLR